MLRLAGRYSDICYIPPWGKMQFEESRKLVLAEAARHNRQDKVAFAKAYTPLGPNQKYNREQYRAEVGKAVTEGFSYFITAFNLEVAPWEVDERNVQKVTESYLSSLRDFSQNIMPSFR